MRVLIDYRPALRERSGVGEYVFQLTRALLAEFPAAGADRPLDLTLFSSSWKDRMEPDPAIESATVIDRRVPVGVLNLAWHRLEWPSAEALTGRSFDVVHSPHPLLLPSRAAATVVSIHDLYFLTHPERSHAEVRRDYPALTRDHARRADRIIVPSPFTGREVQRRLDVPESRISVCPHGRPDWSPREKAPDAGYVLFFGTLEPRKNVAGLLDAYERLLERSQGRPIPELLLAGAAPESATPLLDRIARAPLRGAVRHRGYVDAGQRRALYEGARLLVMPSFDEGFGLPVLEAMTTGVPVVAANRGALPELLDGAGLLVEPGDGEGMAEAIDRMLHDDALVSACVAKGLQRARQFDWQRAARQVYEAYQRAIDHRVCASA